MLEQRTDAWYQARIGKVTASRISKLNAKPAKGKALNALELELLTERITGQAVDNFTSPAMQWGIDTEPLARQAYELQYFCTVMEIGLIDHPTIAMSGASPDGLVGDDGLIEIKCPNTATHISTLVSDEVPYEYIHQMQWQMACTGRKWCDFVSFDPRLTDKPLFIKRVYRDDKQIAELEQLVIDWNDKCEKLISEIKNERQ